MRRLHLSLRLSLCCAAIAIAAPSAADVFMRATPHVFDDFPAPGIDLPTKLQPLDPNAPPVDDGGAVDPPGEEDQTGVETVHVAVTFLSFVKSETGGVTDVVFTRNGAVVQPTSVSTISGDASAAALVFDGDASTVWKGAAGLMVAAAFPKDQVPDKAKVWAPDAKGPETVVVSTKSTFSGGGSGGTGGGSGSGGDDGGGSGSGGGTGGGSGGVNPGPGGWGEGAVVPGIGPWSPGAPAEIPTQPGPDGPLQFPAGWKKVCGPVGPTSSYDKGTYYFANRGVDRPDYCGLGNQAMSAGYLDRNTAFANVQKDKGAALTSYAVAARRWILNDPNLRRHQILEMWVKK